MPRASCFLYNQGKFTKINLKTVKEAPLKSRAVASQHGVVGTGTAVSHGQPLYKTGHIFMCPELKVDFAVVET